MLDGSKTETEQLLDGLTGKGDEQPEEVEQVEETGEEVKTEEELEINDYQTKIDELDARLAEYQAKSIESMKRKEMSNMNYSAEQIERYLTYIDGETVEEIKQSILDLALDIPPRADSYADPSPFNGAKQKPKTADFGDIGRRAFERVKHKIFRGSLF